MLHQTETELKLFTKPKAVVIDEEDRFLVDTFFDCCAIMLGEDVVGEGPTVYVIPRV